MVLRLSALFALDAFGGGFVTQSFAAYWFHLRFGIEPATLGADFFLGEPARGYLRAAGARLAARFGLVRTMVWTHLPSNILLILVPLMPTLPLAVPGAALRFSISQMDVPTRQSYAMAVVPPRERSAAAGVTGVARTIGAAISPSSSACVRSTRADQRAVLPRRHLKIVYDLVLYRQFVSVRPTEESDSRDSPGVCTTSREFSDDKSLHGRQLLPAIVCNSSVRRHLL